MTKSEMQQKLASLGEVPPASWTKVQLSARISELTQAAEVILTEREAAKMINRCKTKLALQELLTEHGLEYTRSQTVDQLRGVMLKYLMENKVPAGASNFMGFGKHSSLNYGQVITHFPSYVTWCVDTASTEGECHWRLRRFALWAQGLSKTEKEVIGRNPDSELESALHAWRPTRRAAPKGYLPRTPASASSSETTEHKWELMSVQPDENHDQEMIPAGSTSSAVRLAEMEEEIRQLKEMVKNNMNSEKDTTRKQPKAEEK